MKFSVSSSELLKKLNIGSGAISANPVMPILEDFLFSIEGNILTLTSTNIETTIVTKLEVIADQDGKIAMPAKILLETLKALPEQPITFVIDEGTNGVELTSAYGKYKLSGNDANDFPETMLEENVKKVPISSSILKKALTKTLFATSNDELRQSMMGVYVNVDFDNIVFVATDAHKLVKYSFGNIKSEITSDFIIPKKGLSLIKSVFDQSEEMVLSFNNNLVFFDLDDTKVIIKLIDAKYPDYNAVIPVNNPNLLKLGRKDLQSSLRRISIYSNKTTHQVIMNLDNASLTISAQDLDFSNEATEQLACDYTGEPMTIGFNAKFLIEMLGILESDDIKLELSTPNKAGILMPAEESEFESLIMLVMPVMMSN